MKLISMHVDNFGGLRNYDYVFEEGLNVVLHDNGWGKTTMAAFLKAMLYGYDNKRSKNITENERKRYLPWQGGKYGGSLDFEANNVRYRIYRTFGETPRFDTVKIINLDTKTTARISPTKIGETLFHLDANAFQRSVFINQNGLSIDGAASSIHTRLNTLVSQANDVAAYDGAIANLTQQIKVYEKTGARGQLGVITRQIAEKERLRDYLERNITEQDIARERISELDILISAINKELGEKSQKLDTVSGEQKKREAEKKLLEDINVHIVDLQKQIDTIKTDLGGHVPSSTDIDRTRRQAQTVADLKIQIEKLEKTHALLTEDYNALLGKYDGNLPQTAQLDKIQTIHGELQGILSASEGEATETEVPEEYEIIAAAVKSDPGYIERLQKTVGLQTLFEELIRKLESLERCIQDDTTAWNEKTKRYTALKKEAQRLSADANKQEAYRPVEVEPAIARLEDLQRKQHAIDLKKESLSETLLTSEQEDLIRNNSGELPVISEGNDILKKQRDVAKREAEVLGLTARLDGEKIKADSLATSLEQLETLSSRDISELKSSEKSSGMGMVTAGAILAVIGVILGIIVTPALFAAAAVGAVLAIVGVVNKTNNKKTLQENIANTSAIAHNNESARRSEDILRQQQNAQLSISELEKQIAELNSLLQAEKAEVSEWFAKWGNLGESPSDTAISQILEKTEKIYKLREKQAGTASAREFIDEQTAIIKTEREIIDATYPECAGMSIQEALSFLRRKLSAYKISESQMQTAKHNLDQFVKETGVTREELESSCSPKAANLKMDRDETAAKLESELEEANKELAVLGLDTDQGHIVQALREAEEMLREYNQYVDKLKDQTGRQSRKQQQVDVLQNKLSEALSPLSSRYTDLAIPERLARIRDEVTEAERIQAKIKDIEEELVQRRNGLAMANNAVTTFSNTYCHFDAEEGDILTAIFEKTSKYAELIAAKEQLEKQRASVESDHSRAIAGEVSSEQDTLKQEVDRLKERRDDLLIEYTQKGDFIRRADESLEVYPDTVQEIHDLYEQKQKAQNTLAILKRSIQLITKAKENLANRYLTKVEDLFNSYIRIWLNSDAVKGLLDIDFNITIEENGMTHVAEGYSTGYYDVIDFCMRLALVDTLFEGEQPFLILDDPFVNLDADRLEKALELLNVMAANKQVVYFTCHPIRAVETEENSTSREDFLKLAEITRKAIVDRHSSDSSRKKIARKSPKEMYKTVDPLKAIPFKPAKPNYTITNSIFSMSFVPNEPGISKDGTYELFFIDAVGHVLNDRQIIEVSNGKLSAERVQFSLNTRDDSGKEFELMIRESGQDDYDVIARFPFHAKLAFTGTFSFDF